MIFSLLGLVIVVVGGAAFWYLQPTDGQIHPLMKLRFLDGIIPVAIVCALFLGIAMMIAGIIG